MRAKLLVSLLVLSAAPSSAQQIRSDSTFALRGQVLDYKSRAPLPGALVEIHELDQTVVADANGYFAVTGLSDGSYTFVASQLGYIMHEEASRIERGGFLMITLIPQPIILEGMEVMVDRLESRRKSIGFSVWALERDELMHAPNGNVADYLALRSRMPLVPCWPPRAHMGPADCTYVRGRNVPVKVWIDEIPVIGGMRELETYRPEDIYLIETYPSLRMIRVYTVWFMERLAKTRRGLAPVCIVC